MSINLFSFNLSFDDIFSNILQKNSLNDNLNENKNINTKKTILYDEKKEDQLNNDLTTIYQKVSATIIQDTHKQVFIDMFKHNFYDEVQDFINIYNNVYKKKEIFKNINDNKFTNIVNLFNYYNTYKEKITNSVKLYMTAENYSILFFKTKNNNTAFDKLKYETLIYFCELKRFRVSALLNILLENTDYTIYSNGNELINFYVDNIKNKTTNLITNKLTYIKCVIKEAGGSGHCFYFSIAAQIYKTAADIDNKYKDLKETYKNRKEYFEVFELYNLCKAYPNPKDFLVNNLRAQAFVRLELYIYIYLN